MNLQEQLKELHDSLEAKLDRKLQNNGVHVQQKDELKDLFKDNYDKIKNAATTPFQVKVVGNMTQAVSLTGDPNRTYSSGVASAPNQAVNVEDLIQTIKIGTGLWTYARETGSEGSISPQLTENTDKSQIDYDISMIDLSTEYTAGILVISKKMLNNLNFIEGWLPNALRRDFYKQINDEYFTILSTNLTPGTLTTGSKVERLVREIATLMNLNFSPNYIVINPSDWADLVLTAGPDGTGDYSTPATLIQAPNGLMQLAGVNIVVATWISPGDYIVADFSYFTKVVTEGLSVDFFKESEDSVRKNNIMVRIEEMHGLALGRLDCGIYSSFDQVT